MTAPLKGGEGGRSGRSKLRFPSHPPWLPSHITLDLSPGQGWVIVCLEANCTHCALGPITSHMGGLQTNHPGGSGVYRRFFQGTKQDNGGGWGVGGHQMPLDGGEQTLPGARVHLLVIFIRAIFRQKTQVEGFNRWCQLYTFYFILYNVLTFR